MFSLNSLSNSNDGDIDSLGQSGKNQDNIFYRNQSSQHSQTTNKINVSLNTFLKNNCWKMLIDLKKTNQYLLN